MDYDIFFVGNTTYDTFGTLQHDITASAFNDLSFLGHSFGGKAANSAVHCASLGAKVAYIGTVGNDFITIGYRHYLEQSHVDISNVFALAHSTPRFFAFHSETNEYWFVSHMQERKDQFNQFQEHLKTIVSQYSARIVYCSLSNEKTVLEVFERSKSSGKQTAWNPITRSPKQEIVEKILRQTDLLFLNEQELAVLENSLATPASHFYTTFGVPIICITRGANGCRLIEKGIATDILTIPVDVITTVGAGDAFAGTFLASYLLASPSVICAELACIAGSLAVQKPRERDTHEMPTLEQLLSLRNVLH
jgi:sugar/nucleoside kinase (ribokinase family)